jgi:hypothetical protein
MNTSNSDNTHVGVDPVQRTPAQEEYARSIKVETAREDSGRPGRDDSPGVRNDSPGGRDDSPGAPEPAGMDRAGPSLDKPRTDGEQLAPLFAQNMASEYRARWDAVQRSFVDDPRRAVQEGEELVTQVMKNLAETFSRERTTLESQLGEADKASTETLRMALRRYRSFFERLLSF